MDIQIIIGNKVKKLRTDHNWTQEKLSEVANVDISYISEIENGYKNCSIVILQKLAIGFNIKITDFFDELYENVPIEDQIEIIKNNLTKLDNDTIRSIYTLIKPLLK